MGHQETQRSAMKCSFLKRQVNYHLYPLNPFPIKNQLLKNKKTGLWGQDGGTGRNTSLPHTTKRRITINLKQTTRTARKTFA